MVHSNAAELPEPASCLPRLAKHKIAARPWQGWASVSPGQSARSSRSWQQLVPSTRCRTGEYFGTQAIAYITLCQIESTTTDCNYGGSAYALHTPHLPAHRRTGKVTACRFGSEACSPLLYSRQIQPPTAASVTQVALCGQGERVVHTCVLSITLEIAAAKP